MDGDGGVVDERREELRERRKEHGRLTARFFVAVSLNLSAGVCKRVTGLDGSGTENGDHVAFYWAKKFNRMAEISCMIVITQIVFATVVMARRMRSLRRDCDVQLVVGFICLSVSLCFSAYLRWFAAFHRFLFGSWNCAFFSFSLGFVFLNITVS
ncbi:PREDICTED: uncharacterized protein LOC104756540 [Camelina sativa]|uniref:Uncharacterized protein LOC104756540 n=1 Tax=Camelina sativa TaxID=90675 RepID=A0ABM0WX64_CAMSA|nr:PREDICTED: uncharacterized protein LOC104756540 [Camelina sativa]